jgi:tetratricopeptide (TPR) repeat protein
MNAFLKQSLIAIGIILALLGAVFGSFLPFAKAKLYVQAMAELQFQRIKTLDEFKKNFDAVLNYYSPVGREEVVRFLAQEIVSRMIYQEQREAVSRELANYIGPRLMRDNSKHLALLTAIHGKMFNIYRHKDDLLKTEEYHQKLLILNPKSPQALYGLFDIYQRTGETEKSKEIGGTILKYWPEDNRIKEIINLL